MKGFGKYGRKVSWMVKIYGKCGWKVGEEWKDMAIMEETQVE